MGNGKRWPEVSENSVHRLIDGVFKRIRDRVFKFGRPLLDVLKDAPFSQITSVKELIFDEARAVERIFIFARDISHADQDNEMKAMVRANVERNVQYIYLLPDDRGVRKAFGRIKDEVTKQASRDMFQAWFVESDLIENEITIIDPGKSHCSAYMLDVFAAGQYALKLDDKVRGVVLKRFLNVLKTKAWVKPED